ncbi:MAG: hypothetical protein M3406_12395 [Chloroflexota bacterium]|nr:hypothetical protein [Chloroflexota bacterium]
MIQTLNQSSPRRLPRPSSRLFAGSLAIIGAVLVAVGVALPWLSFFAGLQPITALGTPNGSLLLVGAAAVGALGMVVIVRGTRWARRGLTLLGIVLTAFAAYLGVGLVTIYRDVSADPLVVAQLGPGLAVVAAGALIVVATSFIGD